MKRLERHAKIQWILADFKGLKYIVGAKTRKKHKYAASMLDTDGQEQTERQHIANSSVEFALSKTAFQSSRRL